MKILNADEAEGLNPLGRGRFNWLYKQLILLKAGEGIVIRYTSWVTKNTQCKIIRIVAKTELPIQYGRHPYI